MRVRAARALLAVSGRLSAIFATPPVLAAACIKQHRVLLAAPLMTAAPLAAAAIRNGFVLYLLTTARGVHGGTGGYRIDARCGGRPPIVGLQALHAAVFRNEGQPLHADIIRNPPLEPPVAAVVIL